MPRTASPALVFALFAGLMGFAVAGFMPQIFNDADTWWHLAAGRWMIAHRTVPMRDLFSFTFAGKPWDAQEWLAEIAMAAVFRVGGWSGLHLLFGAAAGATAAMVAGFLRARLAAIPALLAALLGLACMTGGLLARPHMLALPLAALWTLELVRARERRHAPNLWLVLAMLVWANLHGSFAFGLALAAVFAAEAIIEKRAAMRGWGVFLLLSLAAAAITPQGLVGLWFPVRLLAMSGIERIGEWAPTDLTRSIPFAAALAMLVFAGFKGALKPPPLRGLIVLGLVYLALAHQRHQMLFGVVAPLVLAPTLGAAWPAQKESQRGWPAALAAALLILVVALRVALPTARGDDRVSPMTALASVPASVRARPVLNAYDFGGYLIFRQVPVFIDGRTDMYGDAFMENYHTMMRPDRRALAAALARWHIGWSILPPGPAALMMDTLPGWHRSYSDAYAVVDIRN